MGNPGQQWFTHIRNNRLSEVKAALEANPELIHLRSSCYTPVQVACLSGVGSKVLEVLLEAGGDPNEVAGKRWPERAYTPLRLALQHSPALVGALLRAGAQPLEGPRRGEKQALHAYHRSDLQWAVAVAPQWVPAMLQHGLSPEAKGSACLEIPLATVLSKAFSVGKQSNWDVFSRYLTALEALHEALGADVWGRPANEKDPSDVAWIGAAYMPLHGLWALRWLPGMAFQPTLLSRLDALLEGLPFPSGLNAQGRPFLIWLSMASQGYLKNAGLSSQEWAIHTQDLIRRFGVPALRALASHAPFSVIGAHLPYWAPTESGTLEWVTRSIEQARWWVQELGVALPPRNHKGDNLAHWWARTSGVFWLGQPGVIEATAGLGLDWLSPNDKGETAEALAWDVFRRKNKVPPLGVFRAVGLDNQLPTPAAPRARARF